MYQSAFYNALKALESIGLLGEQINSTNSTSKIGISNIAGFQRPTYLTGRVNEVTNMHLIEQDCNTVTQPSTNSPRRTHFHLPYSCHHTLLRSETSHLTHAPRLHLYILFCTSSCLFYIGSNTKYYFSIMHSRYRYSA